VVNVKRAITRILGGTEQILEKLEQDYAEEKNRECMELYNAIVELLVENKASIQNTLFVLKMIEFSYLRAKYVELVEGAIKIPEGSIPLPRERNPE